jgi:hypothetical protein
MVIPLANKKFILELIEVPEYFYDYEVVTSDGKTYSANKNIKHYRGIIKGDNNSLAAITLYNDEIMGVIATNEGNFNITKDINSMKYILFNDNNLIREHDFHCGTIDDNSISYSQDILSQKYNLSNTTDLSTQSLIVNRNVKIYLETEYDIYQNKGTRTNVEVFVTGLFNQVALLYQNEDILTTLSQLYIWTTNDPYTATDTEDLLEQFQNNRPVFNGHLGQLLTFRESVNGGIAAGFNGLCNNSAANSLSVAKIHDTYSNIPSYSRSVKVVTHEFGHLLGSRHTHACVWNGNNTAIDGCAGGTEGGCATPSIPSSGTIMSYCDRTGMPGVDFNLGFGSQPGNVIRNNVNNALCLIEILGNSSVNTGQYSTYSIPNLPAGTYLQWMVSNNAHFVGGNTGQSVTIYVTYGSTATIYVNLSGSIYQSLYKNISVNQGIFYVDYYGTYATATLLAPSTACVEWQVVGFSTQYGTGNVSCGASTVTLTPLSNYSSGSVLARIHYSALDGGVVGDWHFAEISIWRPVFDVFNSTCEQGSYSIGLVGNAYCSGGMYYWSVNNEFYAATSDPHITLYGYPSGTYTLSVNYDAGMCDAINLNGSTTIYNECDSYSAYSAAYPNPAGNELIIDREEKGNDIKTNAAIVEQSAEAKNATVKVLLYSHSTTKLVYNKDFPSTTQQIKIDTSKLPNGVYYLNMIENGEKIKEQTIIVSH